MNKITFLAAPPIPLAEENIYFTVKGIELLILL